MLVEDFAPLNVSRYELKLRALRQVSLPAFLGSTLRGAFGHALKDAVCVMSHRNCERCMVAEGCIYPYLFETPAPAGVKLLKGQRQAPHPFILTPPIIKHDDGGAPAQSPPTVERPGVQKPSDGRRIRPVHSTGAAGREGRRTLKPGDELTFGLLLMGRATEYMPFVIYAVSEMARRGLGAERGEFRLQGMALLDEFGVANPINFSESQRVTVPDRSNKDVRDLVRARLNRLTVGRGGRIGLRFVTPARIRVEGDLQSSLSFELLVRNLLRRVSTLALIHGGVPMQVDYRGLIDLASEAKTASSRLRWWDWERYSNRQEMKMKMGGFVGEVEFSGEATERLLPLVVAGEILHVGAGTSFGLGKYQIQ